jgi:hypothetical protein
MDSFLGAACGVLRALDDAQDIEELWGLSALGFRKQIHRSLDPVGLLAPAWDKTLARCMRRFGHDCIAGLRDHFYSAQDLRELQVFWMDSIEHALEEGRPAIGFGLHGPAFGIIRGLETETENYHVSTFLDGRKDEPVNAMDFGSLHPPRIFALLPSGPVPAYDYESAALEAIKEAVDHHLGQERAEDGAAIEVPPDIVSGMAAYNAWSTAIETGQVNPHWGIGYYAAYFAEARSAAAEWLRRIATRKRFEPAAAYFSQTAAHFDHEVESFKHLPTLFPLNTPEALGDAMRRTEASACLRAARAEHIAGMEALAEAHDVMNAT